MAVIYGAVISVGLWILDGVIFFSFRLKIGRNLGNKSGIDICLLGLV